jgi:hypothetical protein
MSSDFVCARLSHLAKVLAKEVLAANKDVIERMEKFLGK